METRGGREYRCAHTCIYIYTRTPTYLHAYTAYTSMYTFIHTCMYTRACPYILYMRPCIHSYIREYIQTYAFIHTYMYIYTPKHTFIHTCIHTHQRTHSYIHAYIHTYANIRTHMHIYASQRHIPTHMHTYTATHIHTYLHTIHARVHTQKQYNHWTFNLYSGAGNQYKAVTKIGIWLSRKLTFEHRWSQGKGCYYSSL